MSLQSLVTLPGGWVLLCPPQLPRVGTSEQYRVGTTGVAEEAEAGGKTASRSQTSTGFWKFFFFPFLSGLSLFLKKLIYFLLKGNCFTELMRKR